MMMIREEMGRGKPWGGGKKGDRAVQIGDLSDAQFFMLPPVFLDDNIVHLWCYFSKKTEIRGLRSDVLSYLSKQSLIFNSDAFHSWKDRSERFCRSRLMNLREKKVSNNIQLKAKFYPAGESKKTSKYMTEGAVRWMNSTGGKNLE